MEIKYLMEVVVGDEVVRSISLPLTGRLHYSPVPTDHVAFTLGKEPVREHSGTKRWDLSLGGSSGMSFRRGNDHRGGVLFASGPELFRHFEKFLETYKREAHENQQSGASLRRPTRLVFRAPYEGIALAVEESKFSWDRAIEIGPLNYQWSLSLQGYRAEGERETQNVFEKVLGASSLKAAARAIDSATSYAQVAVDQLEGLRGALNNIREPVKAVGRMAQEVSKVASAASGLKSWPHDLASDLFSVANLATQAVYDGWAALPFIDRQSVRSRMIEVLGPMAEVRGETLTWLGLNFIDVRGLEAPSDTVAYRSTSTTRVGATAPGVPYQVKAGQSIGSIAQEVLGDSGFWPEIARLNGAAEPHNTAEGRPFGPGETILVPSSVPTAAGSSTPGDTYGTDLMLGPDGDLVLSGTEDLALVSGKANLVQALTLRANTRQGDNAMFPEIGLPVSVGGSIYAETAGLLASQGRSQFASDPRIEEVTELEVDDSQGDRLIMRALLKPIAAAPFRVSASIQG